MATTIDNSRSIEEEIRRSYSIEALVVTMTTPIDNSRSIEEEEK